MRRSKKIVINRCGNCKFFVKRIKVTKWDVPPSYTKVWAICDKLKVKVPECYHCEFWEGK